MYSVPLLTPFPFFLAPHIRAGTLRLRPTGRRGAGFPTRRLHPGPGQLGPQLVEGRLPRPDRHVPAQLRHAHHPEHVNLANTINWPQPATFSNSITVALDILSPPPPDTSTQTEADRKSRERNREWVAAEEKPTWTCAENVPLVIWHPARTHLSVREIANRTDCKENQTILLLQTPPPLLKHCLCFVFLFFLCCMF